MLCRAESIAAAEKARIVHAPGSAAAGAPARPAVPLPVKGGTASRLDRLGVVGGGPLPADCCTDFLEEGKLITAHGKDVLLQYGACTGRGVHVG